MPIARSSSWLYCPQSPLVLTLTHQEPSLTRVMNFPRPPLTTPPPTSRMAHPEPLLPPRPRTRWFWQGQQRGQKYFHYTLLFTLAASLTVYHFLLPLFPTPDTMPPFPKLQQLLVVRTVAGFHPSSQGQSSSWFDVCIPTPTTVWELWRECVTTHLVTNQGEHTVDFEQLITTPHARRLWATSNHTAILLEFRAWERELNFSINNVLTNIPVHWRIQIVGGPEIMALAQQLYPAEAQAGKLVLTNLGYDSMKQEEVSRVLTDLGFYQQLLGDTWLFFQYDSAICSQQRHLLAYFLEKEYGWWGAPWRHWNRLPHFCGNGGFSLRRRAFVTTILTLFPWVDQKESNNEDWFMCNKACDLYHNNSDAARALLRRAPYLTPAPTLEATEFSVESIYHEKPFAVHQFWGGLFVSSTTALQSFFNSCPEAWELLPENVLSQRQEWKDVLCAEEGVGEKQIRLRRYWKECARVQGEG